MARKGFNRHSTVVTGVDDAGKQVSLDAWNDDLDKTGMLGFAPTTPNISISSGALAITDTWTVVDAEGAPTTDTLDNLTTADTSTEDVVFLTADTSQVITLTHQAGGAGQIHLLSGSDVILDENVPVLLIRSGDDWYEFGGSVGGGTSFIGFTADADLEMGTFDIEMGDGQTIHWAGLGDSTITNAGGGLAYDVTTNDVHSWRVAGTEIAKIDGNPSNPRLEMQAGKHLMLTGTGKIKFGSVSGFEDEGTITSDAGGIIFDVPTADTYDWKVNGSSEMTLDVTQPNPKLDFSQSSGLNGLKVNFKFGGGIQFLSSSGHGLFGDQNGIKYKVLVGDQHEWTIEPSGKQEMRLDINSLDIDEKYLEIGSIAEPGASANAQTGRIFMDSGNSDHLSIKRDTTVVDLETVGGGSQTPWTSDIDADGFDLTDLSNIVFRATTGAPTAGAQAIWADSAGIKFDTPTGDQYNFRIQASTILSLSVSGVNLLSNNLENVGQIQFGGGESIGFESADMIFDVTATNFFSWDIAGTSEMTLDDTILDVSAKRILLGSGQIEFQTSGVKIQGASDTMIFSTITGQDFVYEINLFPEYTYDATQADFSGNNLVNFGYIESDATNPSTVGEVRLGEAEEIAWRNNANDGDLILLINASDQLVFDGTILGAGGGSQTPWTSNIEAAGFNLRNVDFIETNATPSASIGTIRMGNGQSIAWLNSSQTGNHQIFFDGANKFVIRISTAGGNDFTWQEEGSEWFGKYMRNMGKLSFDDLDTSIEQSATEINYDVATGGSHDFRVDNSIKVRINASTLNLQTGVELGMGNGERITWGANANRVILNDTGGFEFKVETGDNFIYQFQGVTEYVFNSTTFDMGDNDLINFGIMRSNDGATTTAGAVRLGEAEEIVWRNNANDGNLVLLINASDELVFDGTILGAGGASQTPWTSNIDGAGFNLFDVGIVFEQQNSTGSLQHNFFVDTAVADDTLIAEIRFTALDGIAALQNYARITGIMESDVDGTEDGSLQFLVMRGGNEEPVMEFNNASDNMIDIHKSINLDDALQISWGGTSNRRIVNTTSGFTFEIESSDTFDFDINNVTEMRIQADGDLDLFQNTLVWSTDAHSISSASNSLSINTGVQTDTIQLQTGGAPRLTVNGSTSISITNVNELDLNEIDITNVGLLNLKIDDTTAVMELEANHTTPANDQVVGQIDFVDDDDIGARRTYAQIRTLVEDPTNTAIHGQVFFSVQQAGSLTDYMTFNENLNSDVTIKKTLVMGSQNINFEAGALVFRTNTFIFVDASGNLDIVTQAPDVISLKPSGADEYVFSNIQADWNGNNLINMGGLYFDDNADSFIEEQSDGILKLNVQTAGTVRLSVAGSPEYDFSSTALDLKGNILQFGTSDETIELVGGDLEYNVTTASRHEFKINNANIVLIGDNPLALVMAGGMNLIMDTIGQNGYIRMGNMTTPVTPGNGFGQWYVKEVATVTHAFFIADDGTEFDLTQGGGGSQTPWTSDIDADGFDLTDLSNIELRVTTGAPADATRAIYGTADDMIFNVPLADGWLFKVNNITRYALSNDGNASGFNSIADNTANPANVGILRQGNNTGGIAWRNAGNTANLRITVNASDEFVILGGDMDFQGNDITGVGNFTFTDNTAILTWATGETIGIENNDFVFDVTTGDSFRYDIAGVNESFINKEGVTTSGSFVFQGIAVPPSSTKVYISHSGTSMELHQGTGGGLNIRYGNSLEYFFSATTFDINGNNMQELEFMTSNAQAETGSPPASTGFIRMGEAQEVVWRNNANDGDLILLINASDQLVFDGTILGAGGGSQTPWTSDIDADGFDLTDLGNIEFRDPSAGLPAGSVKYISTTGSSMSFNVPTADSYLFKIDGTNFYSFNSTSFETQNHNIVLGSGQLIWTTGESIGMETNDMHFDVTTGNTFSWDINGVPQAVLTTTSLDLSLGTDKNLEMKDNVRIRWNGTNNQAILSNVAGMSFHADTGDEFEWRLSGGLLMSVNVLNGLDLLDLDIIGVGNMTWKTSVRISSTADVDLSATSTPFPIDGITGANGERILLKNQTVGSENGIYVLTTATNPSTWFRAFDFATSKQATTGSMTAVQEGTANANKVFQLTTVEPITLDTTALVFEEFGAGGGSQTPWTSDIDASNNSLSNLDILEFGANVDTPTVGNTEIYSDSSNGNLVYNVPLSEVHVWRINGVDKINLSSGTFDLINSNLAMGSGKIVFTNSNDHFITRSGDNINYEVPTGAIHQWGVNGTPEMSLSATQADFKGNNIVGVDELTITGSIQMSTSEFITWDGDISRGIRNTDLGMFYKVATGDLHEFQVNNSNEFEISAGLIRFMGNDTTLIKNASLDSDATHALTFERPTAQADDYTIGEIRFRHDDGEGSPVIQNYARITGIMGSDDIGDEDGGLELFVTDSGIHDVLYISLNTVVANRIHFSKNLHMGGNIISAIDSLQFDAGTLGAPSVMSIWREGVFMNFNVSVGVGYGFRINDVLEYDFDLTRADFLGNNLINVGFFEDDSTNPASNGAIRLGNGTGIFWRNGANDGDVRIFVGSQDFFSFNEKIVLEGNDLRMLGGEITFDSSDVRKIGIDGSDNMIFDVFTGDTFKWDINSVTEMELSATALTLATGNNIAMANGTQIDWGGSADRRIQNNTSGFTFEVETGDVFFYQIQSVTEYDYNATRADFKGNNLVNVGFFETNATNPASVGEVRLGEAEEIVWRNNANDGDLILLINASDQLVFDGTILGAGGGSLTPWTEDIDADGFDLNDLSNILFRNTTGAPASSVPSIYLDSSNDMSLNVSTGNDIDLKIAGNTRLRVTNTFIDFSNISLTNLDDLKFTIGTPFTSGEIGIFRTVDDLVLHVLTGDGFDFQVAGSSIMNVANGIIGFPTNISLQWAGDGERRISNTTTGFFFVVPTGDTFDWEINNTTEMLLDVSSLDIDAKYMELESIASPGVTGSATTGRIFMDSGNSNELSIIRNGSVISLEGGGGGSQTPWTSDIDADNFDLRDLSNLEFGTTTGAPASNVGYILKDGSGNLTINSPNELILKVNGSNVLRFTAGNVDYHNAPLFNIDSIQMTTGTPLTAGAFGFYRTVDDMIFNVPTGDGFRLNVQGVVEYEFDATTLTMNNNDLHMGSGGTIFFDNAPVQSISATASSMVFNLPSSDFFTFRINSSARFDITDSAARFYGALLEDIGRTRYVLSTATTALDFIDNEWQTISISANTTFTGTGYASGRSKSLRIITDGTLRTLDFPSGWKFLGTKPTAQAANKTGVLTFQVYDTAEADVVCAYAVED